MENKEIVQIPNTQMMAWTPEEVGQQVNAIQYLMSKNMTEGEHWGKIPGCGDKPALLKPGAEKLGLMFRLAAKYDLMEEKMPNGHIDVKVKASLYHINTGAFWGEGLGSCSTMETKFRYRSGVGESTGIQVPKAYWDLRRAGKGAESMELIGGKGYMTKKGKDGLWYICEKIEKTENPDIADTYNTVRKMAKKRAFVDAMLSSTAASDIFTQDIDENLPLPENKEAKKAEVVESLPKGLESFITREEQQQLIIMAGNKNVDLEELKGYLKNVLKADGSAKIKKNDYSKVYEWILKNERDAIDNDIPERMDIGSDKHG